MSACDCGLPHPSYCPPGYPCRWGAAWPRPEVDELPSMESLLWRTTEQQRRAEAYAAARLRMRQCEIEKGRV